MAESSEPDSTGSAHAALDSLGTRSDDDLPPARAALLFSAALWGHIPPTVLENRLGALDRLGQKFQAHFNAFSTRHQALCAVFHDQDGYRGSLPEASPTESDDMIRVVTNRQGSPLSLAVLLFHAGRAAGIDIHILPFPDTPLIRMDDSGTRLVFDPRACHVPLDAAALRARAKAALGDSSELSAAYYVPLSGREAALRATNALKQHLVQTEDYAMAIKAVRLQKRIAPMDWRLHLEEAILLAQTRQIPEAIAALEHCIDQAPSARDRHNAENFLRHLHATVHERL